MTSLHIILHMTALCTSADSMPCWSSTDLKAWFTHNTGWTLTPQADRSNEQTYLMTDKLKHKCQWEAISSHPLPTRHTIKGKPWGSSHFTTSSNPSVLTEVTMRWKLNAALIDQEGNWLPDYLQQQYWSFLLQLSSLDFRWWSGTFGTCPCTISGECHTSFRHLEPGLPGLRNINSFVLYSVITFFCYSRGSIIGVVLVVRCLSLELSINTNQKSLCGEIALECAGRGAGCGPVPRGPGSWRGVKWDNLYLESPELNSTTEDQLTGLRSQMADLKHYHNSGDSNQSDSDIL
jgi:hypothetical protein